MKHMIEIATVVLLFGYSIDDIRTKSVRIPPLCFLLVIGILHFVFLENAAKYGSAIGVSIGLLLCLFSFVTEQALGLGDALVILLVGLFQGAVFQIYMMTFASLSTIPLVIILTCKHKFLCKGRRGIKGHIISGDKKWKDHDMPFMPFLCMGYVCATCLSHGWI